MLMLMLLVWFWVHMIEKCAEAYLADADPQSRLLDIGCRLVESTKEAHRGFSGAILSSSIQVSEQSQDILLGRDVGRV